MDAGWLKTYDEYYTTQVHQIFESVINVLNSQSDYRYTVGDIAFFRRYFEEQQPAR